MCENCVTDIPTKQSGSFDGQLRAFVKDLLSSLDVQLWWQEHSGSIRQPFKNLVAMWMKDLEIVNATSESSWRSNIESVLATYAADGRGDSDVIARTLKNAIREANDTSAPETLKYLERLVEANFNGTRDAVGAWVRMQRKIPVAIVIARGILQPLIDKLSCLGGFDILFLELIDLENPSQEQWWRNSISLLHKSLKMNLSLVVAQVYGGRFETIVWVEIAKLLNAGELDEA